MKTVSYIPSNDELILRMRPLKRKPTRELGRFKLWWDNEGCIGGIDIQSFTEELEEFKRNLYTARLGGIWKGVEITEEEIKEVREDLLNRLQEKW